MTRVSGQLQLILVCGLHRSGTTFVGEFIRRSGVIVVHEPLNEHFGIAGVDTAYPYVGADGGHYADLIDSAAEFTRPWNRNPEHLSASPIRRTLYRLTGGRSGIAWTVLRARRQIGLLPRRICFKDPFATLAIERFETRYSVRSVCLVRHPAAIFDSTRRQGWSFDAKKLSSQPEVRARFRDNVSAAHWRMAESSDAAGIALLWKIMMLIVGTQNENGRRLIVRHEDLCIDPEATTRTICAHVGVDFHDAVRGFVIQSSAGTEAQPSYRGRHHFERDTAALASAWRGRLNREDETVIKDIAGEEIERLYGRW